MNESERTLSHELADDLVWLEKHALRSPERSDRAVPLRFAGALVRNLVGPSLDRQPVPPLHVAVVGGAGTGKSTVANLLCGTVVAEANPQAGFTRHPVAHTFPGGEASWPSRNGFLGPLEKLSYAGPSSIDEDLYQIRQVPLDDNSRLLERFVVWDCPDMTTFAASGYAPRLLEIAGLADVIVFVASDERYNDAVPTQFLRLFLEANKPVVVVLTKMKPENAATIIDHFKKDVLAKLPTGRVATLAVPHLTPEELAEPAGKAGQYRIPLVNQVVVLGEDGRQLRSQNARSAVAFLKRQTDDILAVVRDDIAAADEWRRCVRRGQGEFEDRYQREYLSGAKFQRFDEALVRLIEMLELPGAGKFLADTLHVIRTPYRLVRGFIGKVFGPPDAPPIPEQPVLEAAAAAWVDGMRANALELESRHELWALVARGFQGELREEFQKQFQSGLANFRASQTDEVDQTARAIYQDLEKSPGTLKALRGSKFALDVAAIGAGLVVGHIGLHDFIVVPLAAGISQQLVEWLGAGYVETQRDKARQRQRDLVHRHLSEPLAQCLERWPAAAAQDFARLEEVVARVPATIAKLDAALRAGPA